MFLDPRDLISRVLLETGEWDPATWSAIAAHLPAGGTFVDVGAHMGHCSLMAATLVGAGGRVVAVEANPEMVECLSRNILASGAVVDVQPMACYGSEILINLFVASHANSGSSSISRDNASLGGGAQKNHCVQARPLDAILKDLKITRVDVLKIDVEGAELQVLHGARETLTSCRPVVVIELDDQLLNAMGTSSVEIHNFLASYGYVYNGTFDDANVKFAHRGTA
jgi:FkbM family methyltransferase